MGSEVEVVVGPYDPKWNDLFLQEKTALDQALATNQVDVLHIGSTSVPGLVSKGIIDILLQFDSPTQLQELDKTLTALGYRNKQVFKLDNCLYYVRGDRLEGYHVHVVPKGHACAQAYLCFRDVLRSSDPIRDAYGFVKKELASRYADDRAAYREAKRVFIRQILVECTRLDPAVIDQSQTCYKKHKRQAE